MKIIICSDLSSGVDAVQDWLKFNAIDFESIILWDNNHCDYKLPTEIDNSIMVMNHFLLWHFLDSATGIDQLTNLLGHNNQIWFVGMDSAVSLTWAFKDKKSNKDKIQTLDNLIRQGKIIYFSDAIFVADFFTNQLKNIKIWYLKYNYFFLIPRIQARTSLKTHCQFDYLLTMRKKINRLHRDLLWQELHKRNGLINRGLTLYNDINNDHWIGRKPATNNWKDGHCSMDLYLDCWLEIVPETCYRDLYFFTEKTFKPIQTKTPFLVISTAGYLDYLKNLGFHTFSCLIDEGYDKHHQIEDRVKHMADVLEEIVSHGAANFYASSQEILDHNFSRLCEISGGWKHHFDLTLWQALEEFNESQN